MAKIPTTINGIQITKNQLLVGPYRVLPGRLSVRFKLTYSGLENVWRY